MMETWLPFCVRRPGPSHKQGYSGVPNRALSIIEGEIDHSFEGYRAGAMSVLFGAVQSSWHFSVYKFAEPEQHYPLESITWHAGLPGDRRTDTSLIGNLTLVGIEHEGVAGQPLTASQFAWSVKITQAIRDLCPHVQSNPPALRVNLWEHNWVNPTSCPSGRIPWAAKIAALQEDDMPLNDADKKWIKDEIGAAFGRFVGPRQSGTLAQVLRTPENYEDLVHAVSMAAVSGAPSVQPSPVVQAIRANIPDVSSGSSDGSDHAHEATVTSKVTLA